MMGVRSETAACGCRPESGPAAMHRHCVDDVQRVFDALFFTSHNTRLLAASDEPLYLPADGENDCHRIYFVSDYFSSALHEVSHWCIAGEQRRRQLDYGYWYVPDGRCDAQQRAFERVEVKPQALEWIFSQACGRRFYVSADNLNGECGDDAAFRAALVRQLAEYCDRGLSPRAKQFRHALCECYGTSKALSFADFGALL